MEKATQTYKIRRRLESPYVHLLDNTELDKDLQGTYATKEEAVKACDDLLIKYFQGYIEDWESWKKEDMYS